MTTLTERPAPQAQHLPVPSAPTGTNSPRRVRSFLERHRGALLWLSPVMLIAGLVQAINLGGSPQRIDDEGTYTAQAWAINNLGELAHYTYWYDHPPLGWIQIAAWTGLTGGFQRYDVAVLAAREAMVVATLISVVLLWMLARRIGLSRAASAVSGLIFAMSPLAVQFHRTVYLDNVATPWLLASILLAMTKTKQLAGFAGSAVALGIAVLSKETYLLALPLVAWLMWRNARPETRRYTLSVAGTILVLIGASYLMLATVKGELTPGADRVSLLDGILFQLASRESSGSVFETGTLANDTASVWLQLDPVIAIVAPLAALAALFIARLRPFAIALVVLIGVLLRPGGYLPVPYVIMLLPFAALLIAGVTDAAIRSFRRRRAASRIPNVVWAVAMVAAVAVVVPTWGTQLRGLLLADLDAPSRQAQDWVATNVSKDSRLIVDDAMWVDMVNAGFDRDNVIWFYKLDTDPAVQAQSPNGWRDSDFVITTDSMVSSPNAASAGSAIENSTVVASFGDGDQQVEVRRIDAEGIEAADAAEATAAATRAEAGSELSQNTGLQASAREIDRLRAGQVDARVSIALGLIASEGSVAVDDFPVIDGEDVDGDAGLVFRQVDISSVAGSAVVRNGRMTDAGSAVVGLLASSLTPQSVDVVGGALRVTFPVMAPGPVVQ